MSYIPYPKNTSINSDAGGRTRSSEMTTLFDGKCLNTDNPFVYENVGTGTGTFVVNQYNMTVGVGQYLIRRSKRVMPYFSGKSQLVEMTFDHFAPETGVEKLLGYYDTAPVAPYNTVYDGFWVESDGTTIRFKLSHNGVIVVDVPWTSWDNYSSVAGYNWDNFTVMAFDFLWLGGATVRVFLKTVDGFVLVHTYSHASTAPDVMFHTPNHSLRYEIRSSTGTGFMNAICSQCATEGSSAESGNSLAIYSPTAITVNTVGTIYALIGIKKTAAQRDKTVGVTSIGASNTATTDSGILMLIANPTISAPLTYNARSDISVAFATTQTITAGSGRVIHAIPSGTVGAGYGLNDSYLSFIGMDINDISDEYVLAYMPTSANQSIFGTVTVKEY
jgi:hypothetical protein